MSHGCAEKSRTQLIYVKEGSRSALLSCEAVPLILFNWVDYLGGKRYQGGGSKVTDVLLIYQSVIFSHL
jgi:hypothetical protein